MPSTSEAFLESPFNKSVEEICSFYNLNPKTGLNSKQVEENRKKYGKNELPAEESTPLWKLIMEQFEDQLVIILLMAAGISFVLAILENPSPSSPGEGATAFVEPIVILLILIANATVGVVQETNAEKAIDALKEYSPDEAKVLRNGRLLKLNAVDLVPGDIIDVAVGDRVPADARVISIQSSVLRADQALLTGESYSVNKEVSVVTDSNAVKQDQINIIFSGTTIVLGKARAVVVATGLDTAIGDIHAEIANHEAEKTPLKKKLDEFGDTLAKVISVICILVWIINIRHFSEPSHGGWLKGAIYYFKIAVALAVAAIPEGLAAVITACLALGTKKMAARGAIVRSLPSVETLGATSVICSDKTGTLTTNQMSIRKVLVVRDANNVDLVEYDVEGSSYAPEGNVREVSTGEIVQSAAATSRAMNDLVTVCALCNDSRIEYDTHTNTHVNIGEPTEAALKVLVEKLSTDDTSFNDTLSGMNKVDRAAACNDHYSHKFDRLATLEFSRDRKSMSVLVSKLPGKTGRYSSQSSSDILLVKGAPESILERCTSIRLSTSDGPAVPMTSHIRDAITKKINEYGGAMALRCLALAMVENVSPKRDSWDLRDPAKFVQYEQNMVFIGLVGMMDPPRSEIKESIIKCRSAGVRVIVITGDNKKTAEAICRNIGIFRENEDLTGKSYTGREFDGLTREEKIAAVERASLFSRTEPTHKSELVDLLQSLGHIVAMTGDGVNDAPALRKADIGVAMGSGTDVARLAADMVLADDNFATIESAVEEGRAIYNNTKQFIRYLISSNIGEVVSIFLTVLLGMPEALIPVQLLWVNLVTDGLPATALGFNPADNEIMRRPPRDPKEPIVGGWLFFRYCVIGTYVGVATVFGYAWWFMFYTGGPQITFHELTNFHDCANLFPDLDCAMFTNTFAQKATTMSLSILVTIEMFNAMNSLSENDSLLTLPLWKNLVLVASICLSMMLHFMILYVPFFANIFEIVPLNWDEWMAVLWISFPVILIDEVLKALSRNVVSPPTKVKKD